MRLSARNVVVGLAAVVCLAGRAEAGAYFCFKTSRGPQIDGKVADDPGWRVAPRATGFYVLGGGHTKAKQTEVQACWDGQALYVAMVCEEPDAAEIKPSIVDGGPTWTEDSVEVFLQSKPGGQVYQFGVTAGGAKGSGEGAPEIAKCTAAAAIGEKSYAIEIRIPFAVLGVAAPAPGAEWRGTFCRNIFTVTSGGDKFTSWASLESRFLEPQNFARIEFRGEPADAAVAARLTEELNRDYRGALVGELQAAAEQSGTYVSALEKAVGHERFDAQARDLLAQWRRIGETNKRAETAPVLDIRQALMTVRALSRASYEVKYRYLLHELLKGR